jgi:serine/threonine-protein kinase
VILAHHRFNDEEGRPMIGEKIGSFRLEAVLGTGAMGVVYRGTLEKTGEPVAVKVIDSELAYHSKASHRFRREARLLQQLRHPNIVRFVGSGRERGQSYLAMEYIAGETLQQVLEKRGPLPWREVVEMAIPICEALHYAHKGGVVHRDLKPSNLMISKDGEIKLTDFGVAKDLNAAALTAQGRTVGTPAYMAPEQIRGTPPVSPKTDLYALGIVLYQMVTGRLPFSAASPVVLLQYHLTQIPPRPHDQRPDIPPELDDLIFAMLAKSPAGRPPDAAQAALKLTEIQRRYEPAKRAPLTPNMKTTVKPRKKSNTSLISRLLAWWRTPSRLSSKGIFKF